MMTSRTLLPLPSLLTSGQPLTPPAMSQTTPLPLLHRENKAVRREAFCCSTEPQFCPLTPQLLLPWLPPHLPTACRSLSVAPSSLVPSLRILAMRITLNLPTLKHSSKSSFQALPPASLHASFPCPTQFASLKHPARVTSTTCLLWPRQSPTHWGPLWASCEFPQASSSCN